MICPLNRRKEIWLKHLVRLVQDSFRIGSGIVPCLQGDLNRSQNSFREITGKVRIMPVVVEKQLYVLNMN